MKYLFLILFISGCGSIKVSPRSCGGNGEFGSIDSVYKYRIKNTYYAFLGERELKLKEMIECEKVDQLKISIEKSFFVKYKVIVDFTEI